MRSRSRHPIFKRRWSLETKASRKGLEVDAWYSGKNREFGGAIQALMNPKGQPR
jgi:hypothetical protein